jgi:hypothetical protein
MADAAYAREVAVDVAAAWAHYPEVARAAAAALASPPRELLLSAVTPDGRPADTCRTLSDGARDVHMVTYTLTSGAVVRAALVTGECDDMLMTARAAELAARHAPPAWPLPTEATVLTRAQVDAELERMEQLLDEVDGQAEPTAASHRRSTRTNPFLSQPHLLAMMLLCPG